MTKRVKKKKVIKKKNTKRKKNTKGKKKEEYSNEIWTYKPIPFLSIFDQKYDEKKYVKSMDDFLSSSRKIYLIISLVPQIIKQLLTTSTIQSIINIDTFKQIVPSLYYQYNEQDLLDEYDKSITIPKRKFLESKKISFDGIITQMYNMDNNIMTLKVTVVEGEIYLDGIKKDIILKNKDTFILDVSDKSNSGTVFKISDSYQTLDNGEQYVKREGTPGNNNAKVIVEINVENWPMERIYINLTDYQDAPARNVTYHYYLNDDKSNKDNNIHVLHPSSPYVDENEVEK